MDQNLTYQKARRIRGTKITDLLSDQLLYDQSIGSAVKNTISLKTQSAIRGVKEKFDPLNIAKFLTGGSSLAPALIGRIMGRSVKDIEYFTGRYSPIRVGGSRGTASKITPMPGQDGDIGGINEQLLEIYNFLKISNEENIKRKEKEQNFKEEKEIESERRHKEFIDALQKLTGKKTTTTVVVKGKEEKGFFGNLFGNLEEMVKGIVDKVLDGFSWLKDLKDLASMKDLFKFLGSPIFRLLLNPAVLYVGTVLGLAYLLRKFVETIPDYSKMTPEEARSVLENGSERDIEALGGRERLMEVAGLNRKITKAEAVNILTDPRYELTDEERKVYENIAGYVPQTETQLGNVTPRNIYGGGGPNAQKEWDAKFGDRWNPDGTPKVQTTAKPLTQGVEPSVAGAGRGEAQLTDYLARKDEQETGGRASFGVRPKGIPTVDDRLNRLMNENTDVNLPKKPNTEAQSVVNNIFQSRNNQKQELARLDEIAVHNDEPTFMRMIMDSTRLV